LSTREHGNKAKSIPTELIELDKTMGVTFLGHIPFGNTFSHAQFAIAKPVV
jgi:hypothetical protein